LGLRAIRFRLPALFAVPAIIRAQAAVEYAARAGSGSIASSVNATIAGCPVDSALASCLGHSYPRTLLAIAAFVTLLLVRSLARRIRA
jgi:hypothetical protein